MTTAPSTPLLQLQNVGMRFEEKQVLHGIDLTINAGDFWVFVGPNGGGKTTLLRLLAGLLQPTEGVIYRDKTLRIGYLPQYRRIDRQFPLTVAEILLSGLHNRKRFWQRFQRSDRERVAELLEEFELTELSNRPIKALSGGQWQRVLLARAFASAPDLLLMDEPDTHLDAHNRHFLYNRLQNLPPNVATVLVSHDAVTFPNQQFLRLGE